MVAINTATVPRQQGYTNVTLFAVILATAVLTNVGFLTLSNAGFGGGQTAMPQRVPKKPKAHHHKVPPMDAASVLDQVHHVLPNAVYAESEKVKSAPKVEPKVEAAPQVEPAVKVEAVPVVPVKTAVTAIEVVDPVQGSWIGKDWYPPPGGMLFSPTALQKLYGGRKILWIGDTNLHLIWSNAVKIISTKKPNTEVAELNTIFEAAAGEDEQSMKFVLANCHKEAIKAVKDDAAKGFDIVLLSYGTHSTFGNCKADDSNLQRSHEEMITLLQSASQKVIWTTLGKSGKHLQELNQKMIKLIQSNSQSPITVLDYGLVMKERPDEITVDEKSKTVDYSTEARMTFLQLLSNHLREHYPI